MGEKPELMENLEIERKYLIAMPEKALLSGCERLDIVQTYLKCHSGSARVRKTCRDGECVYTETRKTSLSSMKRIENERVISRGEYERLLLTADETRKPVEKTRYNLYFHGQKFEIDVYPFWQDVAIMEIELESENAPVSLPDSVRVIREVTEDVRYRNSQIAKCLP